MSTDTSHLAIQRAAILGAGTMGAQIAAYMASCGIQCDLLDLSLDIAEKAKQHLRTAKPAVVDNVNVLDMIRPGSFAHDLPRLAEADWVIEAVVERIEPKISLWKQASPYLRDNAILSTNTSGIPIARISQALPAAVRSRFLGTHFFNPPRHLRLLELIPTETTSADTLETIKRFAEETLNKGVVQAHDVPGFITNRIGCFYFLAAMNAADEYGLTPDEADSISGPIMGRSNSATYRTMDLVGLDILVDICDNTRTAVTEPWEQSAFEPPKLLRDMLTRGWLGNKAGQGFYKREVRDGRRHILTLHHQDMRYHERRTSHQPLLADLKAIEDTAARIRALVASETAAGKFAWRTLSRLLAFSAAKVGEVADDIVSIDRAMRWGFNWELGPFETWDALGVAESVRRMRFDGLEVPEWVLKLAQTNSTFYQREGSRIRQATPAGGSIPVCG